MEIKVDPLLLIEYLAAVLGVVATGSRVWAWLKIPSGPNPGLVMITGLCVWSVAVAAALFLQALRVLPFVFCAATLALLILERRRLAALLADRWGVFLMCVVAGLLIAGVQPGNVPSSDHYRWIVLREWATAGGYTRVLYDYRNYSPFYAEMIPLLGWVIQGQGLAYLMNTMPVTALFLMIYELLQFALPLGRRVAFLATLALLGSRLLLVDAVCGFIDSSVAAFLLGAVYAFLLTEEKPAPSGRWVFALISGVAAGSKLHALVCAGILFGLWVLTGLFRGFAQKRVGSSIRFLAGPALLALLVVAPWYIRSWVEVGDPLYPYLSVRAEGMKDHPELEACKMNLDFIHDAYGLPPTWAHVGRLMYTAVASLDVINDDRRYPFLAMLGPLPFAMLPFALFASLRMRSRAGVAAALTAGLVFWYVTSMQARFLLYYLPVLFVLGLAGLAAWITSIRPRLLRGAVVGIVSSCLLLNVAVNMRHYIRYDILGPRIRKASPPGNARSLLDERVRGALGDTEASRASIVSNYGYLYTLPRCCYRNVFYDDITREGRVETARETLTAFARDKVEYLVFAGTFPAHQALASAGANVVAELQGDLRHSPLHTEDGRLIRQMDRRTVLYAVRQKAE